MSEEINHHRRRFLGTAAMTMAAAQFGVIGCAKAQSTAAIQLPTEGAFPSLGSANGWLHSQPLTAAGLRGKVVLIDFWTYTCINWLRTLPYVRAWAEKYKNQGLVVIGVHTPEFAFEKDLENVRRAAKDMRVDYPIAIDSDYAIWRALCFSERIRCEPTQLTWGSTHENSASLRAVVRTRRRSVRSDAGRAGRQAAGGHHRRAARL